MWLYFRCWDNWPRPEPLEDCSHEKYQITVFLMSASILAAFAELFSVIWAIVITSQALRRGGCSGGAEAVTTPEIHGNVKAHNNSLRFNWMSQLASTIVSAVATFIILFIVAYGIQSGDHDRRDFINQKAAIPLWCAPVYLLTAYCGFRAWRFGENSSLISFMVLNICQLALCSTELIFSAFVIRNRDEDDMAIMNVISYHYPNANYRLADDAFRFQPAMIALHAIIIISAFLHFCFSIWGIAAAAIAIREDNTCDRCCCGCCCASDDGDHAEVYYVAPSAAPLIGNIQAGNYAVGGVSVVCQNEAIINSDVSNVVVAGL